VYNLLHLSDRCWLTIDGVVDSHPERIYPFSMFHLLKQRIKKDALPQESNQLISYIIQGASASGKYLYDPKLLVGLAVGAVGLAGLFCVVMWFNAKTLT
jgi:hypothetical protein